MARVCLTVWTENSKFMTRDKNVVLRFWIVLTGNANKVHNVCKRKCY